MLATGCVGGGSSPPGPHTGGSGGGIAGTGGSGAGSGGAAGAGGASPPAGVNEAGQLPLRRLTSREYLNTVRELLGAATLEAADLPRETDDLSNNGFPFRQATPIATFDAISFQEAAERLAAGMASRLPSIVPCLPATAATEGECASAFITTFAPRVFRRPLDASEIDKLIALYTTGRTTLGLDFKGAIGLLLEAMLQSPAFLYHWEVAPGPAVRDGALVQLDGYQVANRLSYFLWGNMPDAALFQAAATGQLATAAGIETQARRLLADDRAQDGVADFVSDLFDVNVLTSRPKDETLYPMWGLELAAAMETEFRTFAATNVLGSGRLFDLLTGTRSAVNEELAAIYGLSDVTGPIPRAVTFDAAERGGLLTLAGFLAVTGASDGSSPVRRGHAVYTRLLCGVVPDPPATVPPVSPPTFGLTTRQRFEEHARSPCAGACHAAMDPIGFGFEHYDGIGRYRATEQNLPVSSTGSIVLDGQTQTFSDALALGKLLASSPQVHKCLATQVTRYALNRWDVAADAPSIEAARAAFTAADFDLRALMTAVATGRTFRFRAPSAGEVLP